MDGKSVNCFSDLNTVRLRNSCGLEMKKDKAPLEAEQVDYFKDSCYGGSDRGGFCKEDMETLQGRAKCLMQFCFCRLSRISPLRYIRALQRLISPE